MNRVLPVATLLVLSGCGHKIGDSCGQNVDCSPLGDRFCDIASPGGDAIASETLYLAVRRLAESKPVVAWIRSVGASGSYFLACGATRILE